MPKLTLLLTLALTSSLCAQLPDQAEMVSHAAAGDGTWTKANELSPNLSSRELFTYALALCEAGEKLDRLETLLEVAARMQDRDEASRGYGNFRWSWQDGSVLDYNAVEFCMQAEAIIRIKHHAAVPEAARKTLDELLDYAVEGCLRHRVPESYTNIALMNAENLILLGEALEKPEIAQEGQARLDRVVLYTWEFGIHEYVSPTYYGTDLDCLVLLEAFTQSDRVREQARALLELFWTDIALNWHEPSQRLAGARSRDYDYLRGLGYLDTQLWANGWLPGEARGGASLVYPALAEWRPPERLRELNGTYPRTVKQSWGISVSQSRTHHLLPDVTLSSSGANYGAMDMPLTVDFPGTREKDLRCYFIPDARRDPYGKKKIPAGPHEKTLHLKPFFAAVQETTDALALVVYRDRDLEESTGTLESHFVMPLDVDELWVGDQRIPVDPTVPMARELERGEALVIRKGTAAVGIRVPWARSLEGADAPTALVYDGNEHGAMRLTVAHHSFWGVDAPESSAAAALWVRVGSGLDSDDALATWRQAFANAEASAEADDGSIRISAHGGLTLATSAPYAGCSEMTPTPSRAILEFNGEDLGKEILGGIEPVKTHEAQLATAPADAISVAEGAYLEVEAGTVVAPMEVGEDEGASGGKFVWAPGEPGERGGSGGTVTWRLHVAREGTYRIWGRVMAPTPDDDSFYVRVFSDTAEPVNMADWHIGTHADWEWTPVALARDTAPTPIILPAGDVSLQLRVREDGAKIDRLFVTPDGDAVPE